LVRIYNPEWLGPIQFSSFGPRHRFDHHRVTVGGPSDDPERRAYYAANDLKGCVVEVFGDTGVITAGDLRVALVQVRRALQLLDLRGDGALAAGSVAALASIPDRPLSQSWARWFYDHPTDFDAIDGLAYLNAHNYDTAYVFFERAEDAVALVGDVRLADTLLRARLRAIAAPLNMIIEPY
jgi:RES domain-containing protein